MLLQFNFSNFKSFRDETSLDMTAASVTEFPEHVVSSGGEKVLPITAIYGPNASGKSNVCEAFDYMREMVLSSFRRSGTDSGLRCARFFDEPSEQKESFFEVFFTNDTDEKGRVYNYGFCIDDNVVVEEWLTAKAKTGKQSKPIFHRNERTEERLLDLPGIGKAFRENIEVSLARDALLLSLGNSLLIPELMAVYAWFERNCSISFGRGETALGKRFEWWFKSHQSREQDVLDYLATFDDSIEGIIVITPELGEFDIGGERSTAEVMALHKTAGISVRGESDGTLQMLDLYPTLAAAFKDGGVVVADELGAHLHPLLLRNVVLSFLNPQVNKGHAQLIFTTHDVWLLFSGLLRRDEVWFTEKDADGASSLYSLADFQDEDGKKIRKDESFGKNYLLGKYGAIPQLSQLGCFS